MSQRVIEVPPYMDVMYEGPEMITRWKGWFLGLDQVINGTQVASSVLTGASPIVAQNVESCDQIYFTAGGAGVIIEYSRDGSTYSPTGVTSGQVIVFPGDFIRITYTTLPTITVVSK